MIIGIAQIDILWEDIISNMKKVESLVKRASKENAELILFPEMSLTGFTMNIDNLLQSEDEILNWIKEIAIRNNINIGLGFAVKVDSKGLNKFAIISNEGKVLVDYTKIHPFSPGGEDKKYYKGDNIFNCEIGKFRITPFICYDLRFSEIFEIASKESEIITIAANWPKSKEEQWITLLKARAIDTQSYIIGINRIGKDESIEYNGASVFVGPNGKIINEITSDEELIIQNLELERIIEIRKKFDVKSDRRADLYRRYQR